MFLANLVAAGLTVVGPKMRELPEDNQGRSDAYRLLYKSDRDRVALTEYGKANFEELFDAYRVTIADCLQVLGVEAYGLAALSASAFGQQVTHLMDLYAAAGAGFRISPYADFGISGAGHLGLDFRILNHSQ